MLSLSNVCTASLMGINVHGPQVVSVCHSIDTCSSFRICCSTYPTETPSMPISVAVLAVIPLRSPQKLFISIIKEIICWVKVSKNKII